MSPPDGFGKVKGRSAEVSVVGMPGLWLVMPAFTMLHSALILAWSG